MSALASLQRTHSQRRGQQRRGPQGGPALAALCPPHGPQNGTGPEDTPPRVGGSERSPQSSPDPTGPASLRTQGEHAIHAPGTEVSGGCGPATPGSGTSSPRHWEGQTSAAEAARLRSVVTAAPRNCSGQHSPPSHLPGDMASAHTCTQGQALRLPSDPECPPGGS